MLGTRVQQARVLDLFAGTGALGLEALSRGAAFAVFVDSAPVAAELIKKNIDRCRMASQTHVYCHDLLSGPDFFMTAGRYDIIFMDPPYREKLIDTLIQMPGFMDLMHDETILVAEYMVHEQPAGLETGFDICKQKKYAKTMVTFLQKQRLPRGDSSE